MDFCICKNGSSLFLKIIYKLNSIIDLATNRQVGFIIINPYLWVSKFAK